MSVLRIASERSVLFEKRHIFRSRNPNPRGALTIYFALTFAVMISLITACIFSAKVEAGRARTANAADQALFSLFANYDQILFDQYQIFMIDGSCGTDHLSASSICNYLSDAADRILDPKKDHFLSKGHAILNLKQTGCGITGYTLATDQNGAAFRAQAVQAEKDTLGLESLSSEKKIRSSDDISAGSAESSIDPNRSFTDYPASDHISADSNPESGEAGETEISVPSDFVNPLPILEALRRSSLLPLVIDAKKHPISGRTVSSSSITLLSMRGLEKGFGLINMNGSSLSASEKLLFQNYLLNHFNCFTDAADDLPIPKYELEYLISGKGTDRENLEKIAKKLLLRREAVNLAYLETNSIRHSEISREALLIASAIGLPGAEPAIQVLLSLAWAFAESLVDLYGLFDGGHTAAVKTAASWQTEISDLPNLAANISSLVKDSSGGLSYRDYLRIFLAGNMLSEKSLNLITLHAMDLIELNVRASGETNFRLDRCMDSVSFELSVTSENKISLTSEASYSYR